MYKPKRSISFTMPGAGRRSKQEEIHVLSTPTAFLGSGLCSIHGLGRQKYINGPMAPDFQKLWAIEVKGWAR